MSLYQLSTSLKLFFREILLLSIFLSFINGNFVFAEDRKHFSSDSKIESNQKSSDNEFATLRSNIKKFTLSNGLRVLFYKRDFAPVFTGQVWLKVGGVDEVPGQTGLAHFLEHMAFKGSKTIGTKNYTKEKPLLEELDELMIERSLLKDTSAVDSKIKQTKEKLKKLWKDNEFSKEYKKRGATGLNAGTSKDYTVYLVDLPSSAFDFWLWMESDRLMNPVFRQFYKEREVIQEERRMRVENNPSGKLYESLLATAFWSHPNRLPVIGWPSDMQHLSASDMRAFYEKYYRPDNMVVVLVGDIPEDGLKDRLENYFGRIKASKKPKSRILLKEEPQNGQREAVVYYDASPQLFMAWHKPAWPNKDDPRFAILHSLLSDGRSSLLYEKLVKEKKIATSVYTTEAPGERYPSLFVIYAKAKKGVSNEELRDEIQKILENLKTEKFPAAKLAAAKRRVRAGMISSLDSNQGIARMLGKTEALWDDWQMSFELYEEILNTTAEDVQNLVKEYLSENKRTYVHLESKKPDSFKTEETNSFKQSSNQESQ